MGTSASGTKVPAGSDVFQPDVDITALANSMHGRINILAANATARTGLASTCGWPPTASDPLMVLQTDTGVVWRYNGTAWIPMTDVFQGGEAVIVGTSPSAGVPIRMQTVMASPTTDASGVATITLPIAAPNAVVAAVPGNATTGSNLSMVVDKTATTLSTVKVKVYFAADSSLYASAVANISLIVTYY